MQGKHTEQRLLLTSSDSVKAELSMQQDGGAETARIQLSTQGGEQQAEAVMHSASSKS